jgi:N-methylhydantoinase B
MAVNPIVSSVDPITFEILSHRVYQISREMGSTLERVGGTVNTTQMHDYMASLYLANGDVLSAGDAMGWHVACAGFAVKRIIEQFENSAGINPDDIFLLNDPFGAMSPAASPPAPPTSVTKVSVFPASSWWSGAS